MLPRVSPGRTDERTAQRLVVPCALQKAAAGKYEPSAHIGRTC
jgi:hypothetical protein